MNLPALHVPIAVVCGPLDLLCLAGLCLVWLFMLYLAATPVRRR